MSSDTIKMLLIDDKMMTSDLDRAGYRKMGVEVLRAMSYDSAEASLKGGEIDIVVINHDYSAVDAPMICKHLKSHDQYSEIPVVITSVQGNAKARNDAKAAGVDLFVVQPVPRQQFIEKIKQLLEQSTRTDERVDVPGEASFSLNGNDFQCEIGDLSTSGMLLAIELVVESGTKLEISFDLPGYKKPARVKGEVVRVIERSYDGDELFGIGLRFLEFSGDSEKRIEKFVSRTSTDDSRMVYYL